MSVSPLPTIGTKLYISATLPATRNAAGFNAINNFVEIGGIITSGARDRAFGSEEITQLGSGGSVSIKTFMPVTTIDTEMLEDMADAGQVLCETAWADTEADYSFQLLLPNGDKVFCTAKVMNFASSALDGNARKRTLSLSVQSPDASPFINVPAP